MTYPPKSTRSLIVNSVDYTGHMQQGSFKVQSTLTHKVDELDVTLIEMAGITILEWDTVIFNVDGAPVFQGFVLKATQTGDDGHEHIVLQCGDYSSYTDHVYAKANYVNQTDAYILNDLFTTFYPQINATTYVTALNTLTTFQINRKKLREILDYLAGLANADWYIDANGYLHYFSLSSNIAPFGISDSPDFVATFPAAHGTLQVVRDGTGITNQIEIVGGTYLGNDQYFNVPGTGKDPRAVIPFSLTGPSTGGNIQVWRNDGTDASPVWTPMTVLTGYINTLTTSTQVLYYEQEQVLQQQNAWPNLQNAIQVFGRNSVPLRVRVRDPESYTFYSRWFYDFLSRPDIVDKALAQLVGKSTLAEISIAQPAITFRTYQPGLRAGMTLTINDAGKNLSGPYLVQQVTFNDLGDGLIGYDIQAGIYSPDLVDMLTQISRNSKPTTPWSTNEVLDELLEVFEICQGTESVAFATSSSPYFISNTLSEACWVGYTGAIG